MPFAKGNNYGRGRGKGTKNFATLERRGLIDYLKNQGADKFIEELHKLEGKEFCQTYIPVVELAFPKQARIEESVEINDKRVVIDKND